MTPPAPPPPAPQAEPEFPPPPPPPPATSRYSTDLGCTTTKLPLDVNVW